MKLYLLVMTVTLFLSSALLAVAKTPSANQTLQAFDSLCVVTRINRKTFESQVKLYKFRKIAEDALHNMSPDNKIGYWVKFENILVAAILGQKVLADGVKSNTCTLVVSRLPLLDAEKILKENFPIQKLEHFKQGSSNISLYKGTFAGFQHVMALSIQVSEGMTSISIFELPDN